MKSDRCQSQSKVNNISQAVLCKPCREPSRWCNIQAPFSAGELVTTCLRSGPKSTSKLLQAGKPFVFTEIDKRKTKNLFSSQFWIKNIGNQKKRPIDNICGPELPETRTASPKELAQNAPSTWKHMVVMADLKLQPQKCPNDQFLDTLNSKVIKKNTYPRAKGIYS